MRILARKEFQGGNGLADVPVQDATEAGEEPGADDESRGEQP